MYPHPYTPSAKPDDPVEERRDKQEEQIHEPEKSEQQPNEQTLETTRSNTNPGS
jgi:hypothetical protein